MKHAILAFLLLSFAFGIHAQQSNPRVDASGRVTFSYVNKDADCVQLKGSFIPKTATIKTPMGSLGISEQIYDMQRTSDDGLWTYTTEPLLSEMYTYQILVDDEPVLDPANQNVVRDVKDMLNFFLIDGDVAKYYFDRNVPHGKVEYVWYPSSMNGMAQRRMAVYTPAVYDEMPQDSFPVLYLLHGSGGDETSWAGRGRAAQILDNMIAAGLVPPLIVVMPNGNVKLDAAPGESPYQDNEPSGINIKSMLGKIEHAFVPEVLGYAEQHYRIRQKREARAIAGLSLGGLHTIYISANSPYTFGYIGLFSAQTTNMISNVEANAIGKLRSAAMELLSLVGITPQEKHDDFAHIDVYEDFDEKLAEQFEAKPYLYYIAVGDDDFVLKLNDDFRRKLDDNNYPYLYHPTDGGHTWENWRKYLVDFLPRLFK